MRDKRFIVIFSVAIFLSLILSPSALGTEQPTQPAKYRKSNVELDVKRPLNDVEKTDEKIPEIIKELQFTPKNESDELIEDISFSGKSNDRILVATTDNLRLFQDTTPLPQQLADHEDTSNAWLAWTLGIIATALLAGWFMYAIPKWFIITEE